MTDIRDRAVSGSPERRLVLVGAPGTAPTDRSAEPAPPSDGPDAPGSGAAAFQEAGRNGPPDALIRLRFGDAVALARAEAAFHTAGPGAGLGDACGDVASLTLRIPGDAGVETVRAVLTVLDAAALTAESLTVHTNELGDVFAAFTSLP
ncbi:hypothetical protein [Streptomyces sp. AM6-12]|uniref:hypothetical protein n=1 Tax=Streptomyces sp. AM6-12 TaxID=3345149 RepID=UPI0037BA943A